MSRRRIRDEADARTCIALWKASGLAAAEWARAEGVDGRSLHAWRVNLERGESGRRAQRASVAPEARLIELMPAERPSARSMYVIRAGTRSVEVDEGFDPSTLRRLLAVLDAC